jgi:formiminoglutamase
MISFKIFSQDDILSYVNQRDRETKLGEKVQVYCPFEEKKEKTIAIEVLKRSTAKFVLIGIPEDIGVRANYGIGGADTAWRPALKAFLNLQQNPFLDGDNILVLGEFEIPKPIDVNINELRNAVEQLDNSVYWLIEQIGLTGKIPIIIGGGHNNAYPIIKGLSLAKKVKINVLNIDAHADLRHTKEGRHSGNGFSYAIENGFLDQYRIFGLHQNYASSSLVDYINHNDNIQALYFDDLLKSGTDLHKQFEMLLDGLKSPLGLEIDLDSIVHVLASAATPSGFSLNDIRKIILSSARSFDYLHICEGASVSENGSTDILIGKTIAYLISDFIKAPHPRNVARP